MPAVASKSPTAATCSIRAATPTPERAPSCSKTTKSCSSISARSPAPGPGVTPRAPMTRKRRSAVDLDLRDARDVGVPTLGVVPPDVVHTVGGLMLVGEVHRTRCAVVVDVGAGLHEVG